MLLVKKGFLKMTKKAPLGAIVGGVLFKAARREQSAIPQKIQRTLVQTLCKLESPSSEAV